MTEKNTELPQKTPSATPSDASRPDVAPPEAGNQGKPAASAPSAAPSGASGSSASKPELSGSSASKPGPTGSSSASSGPGPAGSGAAKPAAAKAAPPAGGAAGARSPSAPRKRGLGWPAFLIALLVAVILAIALWYQQRQFGMMTEQLQQAAGASSSEARQAGQQAEQALTQVRQQAEELRELRSALEESRNQADDLQRAFQLITDSGSELVLLNDVDHLVTIAQQQLQLGGNVANAIISLETAQAQLARANRPGLASLQQTINGDLGKLRAASTIDVALLSSQLEEFGNLVSQAPLMVPDAAAPTPAEPVARQASPAAVETAGRVADEDASWWRLTLNKAGEWSRDTWDALSKDLGSFINVRRIDDESALLMSPDQATRFRENLRLRIMTAQLALMMRQPGIWESETDALLEAVERRYDPQSAQTRQAL
jgi:uroporphyrin-3 C-methyltransferase